MLLEARSITKSFADAPVLRGVTFAVARSEIVALLGPSGCGKSTLLRIIAGLEQEYVGTIIFDGRAIDAIPAHRRGFGLMFQDFALFPHRTVAQNVAFGPRMQRLDRREIGRRVDEALELVDLRAYRDRTIFELSGGERQRVALARSLAAQPKLLLLDEPLGALDRTLRERLTGELRAIIKQLGITSVYVTHDQTEAFAVADRITLMNEGAIVQSGTPAEIYRRPASPFAARFLGLNNLIEGTLPGQGPEMDGQPTMVVQTALGDFHVVAGDSAPAGPEILLLIRPEAAQPASTESTNIVGGTVVQRTFRGGTERIVLRHSSGIELELDVEAGSLPGTGEIRVGLRAEALAILPVRSGR